MKRFITIVTLVLLVFGLSACAHKNRVLYQPAPIAVSNKKVDVKRAIKSALNQYEWRVQSERPNEIIAEQYKHKHQARVKITYDQNQVWVKYLDSNNLLYRIEDDGTPRIHGRYNTWVTNLERAIAANLYGF